MFTGIIEKTGRVQEVVHRGGIGRLVVSCEPWKEPPQVGESIAIEGVCLTVCEYNTDQLFFDVLEETFQRTNLGDKEPGRLVNIERSLRYGDPLGGHIVQGHVDGVGHLLSLGKKGQDHILTIGCGPEILDNTVFKGSIAVNGISLTVAELGDQSFTICIIPHTWEVTSLPEFKPGDRMNLEVDILAKYARKMIASGRLGRDLSWERIREAGQEAL